MSDAIPERIHTFPDGRAARWWREEGGPVCFQGLAPDGAGGWLELEDATASVRIMIYGKANDFGVTATPEGARMAIAVLLANGFSGGNHIMAELARIARSNSGE